MQGGGFRAGDFVAVVNYVAAVTKAHVDRPAHFVGHDLGGLALYWLAQTGFFAPMKSITMISAPHPGAYRRFLASGAAAPKVQYISDILEVSDDVALRGRLLGAFKGSDISLIDEIASALGATDLAAIRAIYAQIRLTAPHAAQLETKPTGCRVAMVYAEADPCFTPDLMQDSAVQFGAGDATLSLPGDSHYPHLTDPARVAAFVQGFWHAVDA